jgi:hypothetical protein
MSEAVWVTLPVGRGAALSQGVGGAGVLGVGGLLVLLGRRAIRRDVAVGLATLVLVEGGLVLLIGRNRVRLVGATMLLVVTRIRGPDRLGWRSRTTFILDSLADQCQQSDRVSCAGAT